MAVESTMASSSPARIEAELDEGASKTTRQCVKYSFFRVDVGFRRLPKERQRELKLELIDTIRSFRRRMLLRSYSLFGLRGDADFLLWQVAEDIESFNALATAIFSTDIGAYLQMPHSFLAMTRKSQYDIDVTNEGREADQLIIQPGDAKYLFVYPFVKTRAWYALPMQDRQRMMTEHIRVGRRYPSIKLNTTYSFGLDDQEFVVAFEGDRLADFLDLVMELRETEASRYTLRDTPTFTCISMGLAETIDSIGGEPVADLAGPDQLVESGWVQALPLRELPAGTAAKVYLGAQLVALFNVDGTIYATVNRCPHARGPLCEGRVGVTQGRPTVVCPWHHAVFDLEDGRALEGPVQTPVKTFAVHIGDDGYIYIAERSAVRDLVDVAR